MKRLLFSIAIILAIFVAYPVGVLATTYYVDNSGCGACADYRITERDCGSGSETNYATIAAAADAVSSAGDMVYIRAGTYTESVFWDTNSGSDPDYITFEACHDGSDGDCSDGDAYETVISQTTSYPGYVRGVDWVKIVGIKFDKNDTSGSALVVNCNAENIYFEDCEFEQGQYTVTVYCDDSSAGNVSSVTFKNCSAHDSNGEGVYFNSTHSETYTISNITWDGGSVYSNNEAFQICKNCDTIGGAGIDTIVIKNADIYSNGGAFGTIHCDAATNVTIEYNKIHDNSTSVGGMAFYGCRSVDVIGNLFYDNDGTYANNSWAASITIADSDYQTSYAAQNINIYNNTFDRQGADDVQGNDNGINLDSGGSGYTSVNIKNNIFNSIEGDSINTNDANVDCQYNNFYNNGADSCDDGNNITTDPAFVSVVDGSENYALDSGSDTIGAGVDLGDGLLYGLDPTSTWTDNVKPIDQDSYGAWEIGAYVYIEAAEFGGPGTIAGGGSGSIAGGGSGSIIGTAP